MKKEYMKPEVNEIAVEANQAIAGCPLPGLANKEFKGYKCEWCGGSESYMSAQQLQEHINPGHNVPDSSIIPAWKVTQVDGPGWFFWEDFDKDGVWDLARDHGGTDGWQDVHWWDAPEGLFNS